MSTVKELVKDRIIDAMEELLKRNSINAISINRIAETAGVSRMTVYRHFKDKYDVAVAIYNRDAYAGWEQFQKDHDYQKMMITGMRRVAEKKEIYKKLFEDDSYQNPFIEGCIEKSRQFFLDTIAPDKMTEETKVALLYTLYGGYFVSWSYIRGEIDMNIEELADTILKCWPTVLK